MPINVNELIRDLESDFELLRDMDLDDIEDDTLREFLRDLRDFGEEHGFDGQQREYTITVYAEFNIHEEAQSPVEAQRRAEERLDTYLTREIADDGFKRKANNLEVINVEELY